MSEYTLDLFSCRSDSLRQTSSTRKDYVTERGRETRTEESNQEGLEIDEKDCLRTVYQLERV